MEYVRETSERLELQWGRNFFVTEIRKYGTNHPRYLGFNGAVTFSLRKSGYASMS